ncbi:MAG: superoxide dismutase, partial [Myroides sp.]
IDKETMIVHHDKHYQAYIDKLNAAISKYPELQDYSLTDLLTNLDSLPKDIALTVKNNAGGAYNHEFFFDIMNPQSSMPKDELFKAIERDFGSYETFRDSFKKAASEVFGSGFAWLVSNSDGCLSIITTPNQDTPISSNLAPIIGLDVWEHAYYLKYQNMRSTYIDNWFKIINWDKALENYENITK